VGRRADSVQKAAPAIDGQDLPGDKPRCIRGEELHRFDQFRRGGDPAQRCGIGDLIPEAGVLFQRGLQACAKATANERVIWSIAAAAIE
jgi:hypothetical protein